MPSFLWRFFPSIAMELESQGADAGPQADPWCIFHDDRLQLFQSLPNLTAVPVAILASFFSQRLGRQPTLLVSALLYLAAVALSAGSCNQAMLLAGRVVLGFALGGLIQSAPLLLSEMVSRAEGRMSLTFC